MPGDSSRFAHHTSVRLNLFAFAERRGEHFKRISEPDSCEMSQFSLTLNLMMKNLIVKKISIADKGLLAPLIIQWE